MEWGAGAAAGDCRLRRSAAGELTIDDNAGGECVLNVAGHVRTTTAALPPVRNTTATVDSTAGARTYTAAEILGGIIERDPNGATRTDVLPTAALLVAAMDSPAVGDFITYYVVNTADAAESIVMTSGVGGTDVGVAGNRTLAQDTSGIFGIRLTNVGSGTEAYRHYNWSR